MSLSTLSHYTAAYRDDILIRHLLSAMDRRICTITHVIFRHLAATAKLFFGVVSYKRKLAFERLGKVPFGSSVDAVVALVPSLLRQRVIS